MALYHKYRPQSFDDLMGQEHIKEILSNALAQDRLGHAYLLAGPRGSGKTTTARLIAKSVNCTSGKGKPCNRCPICQEITVGTSMDVIEIDAASNRGIDEIRELRDKVRFTPTKSRRKIYIIDEVHMLTKDAFNALLKTLEEPPSHALFILATTEPHKVPETILSRVQRFDFHRASESDLTKYLQQIAKKENIQLQPEAAEQLARLATGSFRDAIVLLDQVSHHARQINLEIILKSLGLPSLSEINGLISAFEKQQLPIALEILDRIVKNGKNIVGFIELVIIELRKKLRRAEQPTPIIAWIKMLHQALLATAYSPDPLVPIELAIYEIIGSKTEAAGDTFNRVKKKPTQPIIGNNPPQTFNIHRHWNEVIAEVRKENITLAGFLSSTLPGELKKNKLIVYTKYQFYQDLINQPRNRQIVEKICLKFLDSPVILECKIDSKKVSEQEQKIDSQLMTQVDEVFA